MNDAVGFGCRGQVFVTSFTGKLERVAQDTINAPTCKNAFLYYDLRFRISVQAPTNFRVLAFIVFSHHKKIDVVRPAIAQGRCYSLEQSYRAQIDVLLHLSPDRDQKSPQRYMIGHTGKPYGTQEYRIVVL